MPRLIDTPLDLRDVEIGNVAVSFYLLGRVSGDDTQLGFCLREGDLDIDPAFYRARFGKDLAHFCGRELIPEQLGVNDVATQILPLS